MQSAQSESYTVASFAYESSFWFIQPVDSLSTEDSRRNSDMHDDSILMKLHKIREQRK